MVPSHNKEVVFQIGIPFPFAWEPLQKEEGLGGKAGVSTQFMPGPGQRRGGGAGGKRMKKSSE